MRAARGLLGLKALRSIFQMAARGAPRIKVSEVDFSDDGKAAAEDQRCFTVFFG